MDTNDAPDQRTVFEAKEDREGWWVRDQYGSFYEGPYTTEEKAAKRAARFQAEEDES